MSKKLNSKGKSSPVLTGIAAVLGFLLVVTLALIIYANGLGGSVFDADDTKEVIVTIEPGSTTNDIGDILEEQGIIGDGNSFKLYTMFKHYDGQYQAGSYAFSPSMNAEEIAQIMIQGKTNQITFTIPEGYTEYQIAESLADAGLVEKKSFIKLIESKELVSEFEFLKGAQNNKHRLEGYLFPSTYTMPADSDERDIVYHLLETYDEIFTDEWSARAKELGLTENEVIVIASLIEKEAGVDQDRGKVSSVIYNRLEEGMPLQIDATVQYVRSLNDQDVKEDLTYDDTKVESEYNTYTNTGLPPGPICCPGEASIKAALYPEDTKYLYYVLSDKLDGSHNFSESYEEFEKNKDAYYNAKEAEE